MATRTNNADLLRLASLRRERDRVNDTCRFWARCALVDGDGSEAAGNYEAAWQAAHTLDQQIEELEASISGVYSY